MIEASDSGANPRTDIAILIVEVNRNLNAPVFIAQDSSFSINENKIIGERIGFPILATDADSLVSIFKIKERNLILIFSS